MGARICLVLMQSTFGFLFVGLWENFGSIKCVRVCLAERRRVTRISSEPTADTNNESPPCTAASNSLNTRAHSIARIKVSTRLAKHNVFMNAGRHRNDTTARRWSRYLCIN